MLVGRMLLGAFRPRTTREIKKSQPLSVAEGPRRCWLGICSSPLHKGVILSEARRGSIALHRLYGAKSKDPGDAGWADAPRSFPATNHKGN